MEMRAGGATAVPARADWRASLYALADDYRNRTVAKVTEENRPPIRLDPNVITKLASAALRPIGIARRGQVRHCVFYVNHDAIAWRENCAAEACCVAANEIVREALVARDEVVVHAWCRTARSDDPESFERCA
jgi:hypothetical protein